MNQFDYQIKMLEHTERIIALLTGIRDEVRGAREDNQLRFRASTESPEEILKKDALKKWVSDWSKSREEDEQAEATSPDALLQLEAAKDKLKKLQDLLSTFGSLTSAEPAKEPSTSDEEPQNENG